MHTTNRCVRFVVLFVALVFGLAAEGQVHAQTCTPAPSGLVARWPGNGDANDSVGGRHGTPAGGASYDTGMVGDAFSFHGDGWIEVPDDPVWTLSATDFTIDLWVLFNALGDRISPLVAHDEGTGWVNKWALWWDRVGHPPLPNGPGLRFHVNNPGLGFYTDTIAYPWTPATGTWYHVAMTRAGSTYALYLEGTRVAVRDDPRVLPDPNCPLTIGRAEWTRLNGLTDEVEFFNRALTPSEIHAIYAAGSAGRCGPASLQVARTELAGCLQTTGTVTLAGPAPTGGQTVPLHSDNPYVTVPPSVFVRAGALAKRFTILTNPVTASETATIQASIPGEALSSTLTLKPMGVKTVLLSPDPVAGGGTVAGIVALQCAAGPGDITVNLSSTKPDIAAPTTATVTIPVGTNFLPFEVTTTPVTAEAKATISATANGVKKSKALAVSPGP